MSVVESGRFVGTMEPSANFFGTDPTGVSTPDVLSRTSGDLYLTLLSLDADEAVIAFDTSPLIWLLWVGGAITAAGGILAMRFGRQERVEPVPAAQHA